MARPATAAVRLLTGEREPVRLATTANIDVDAGGLLVIDGVQTEVGDRILLTGQTDGTENGIRTASAGQWFRAADARTAREMQKGTTVTVQEGAYADRTFRFISLNPVIGDTGLDITPDPIALTPLNVPLNPLDFGCTLDGVDSAAAFGDFIDAMVTQGRCGELPEGTITLGSRITRNIGSAALSLKGRGVDVSTLLFTAADGGLDITSTHDATFLQWSRQVAMRDFSIKTNQASGGTALSHTISPVSSSSTSRMFDYQNLSIQGLDVNADYWDNGVIITDGWNGLIADCQIKGIAGDNVSPFEMTDGVKLVRCNDCHIVRLQADHMETGIHATSDLGSYGDGLIIDDCRIIGVGTGILSDSSIVNVWMGIRNNHINAGVKGINLTNIYFTPISENLIYKTHLSSQDFWVGILLASPHFNIVTRNTFSTPGAPVVTTNIGIQVSGGADNIIADNSFNSTTGGFVGVFQSNGTFNNIIRGNIGDTSIDAIVGGDGTATSSFITNNKPITNLATATSGDTTPSVANLIDNILNTANAGATSITTFDDGINQQLLELHIGDANTTLVDGTTLALLGDQNTTPPNGAILTFRKLGIIWTEIGRSYPVGNLIIGSYTKAPQSPIHAYASSNSLQIVERIENDNGGGGVAALGFSVTTSAGETRSAKAGFGLTRNNSNGRGLLDVFLRTTNDTADFDASDIKSGWNATGIFHNFKGADVASASTIIPTGNLFHVTGTTGITSISGTNIRPGTTIRMIFDGILTVTAGSNLKMAGNFTTSASDMLVMTWDGTNWYEEGRSANA